MTLTHPTKLVSFTFSILVITFICGTNLNAAEDKHLVPNEIELNSGKGVAYGAGGVVSSPGLHSIKVNPAHLAIQKSYYSGASYHWPTTGSSYYNLGFIDAKTSKITAGVQYTGHIEKEWNGADSEGIPLSPTKDGINVGLGTQISQKLLLGINGIYKRNHQKGFSEKLVPKKSISFGAGILMVAGKNLVIGASAQNLFNQNPKIVNPKTYLVGIGYRYKDKLNIGLEYKNRKRMEYESETRSEQLLVGSAEAPIRKYLNLIGAYTYELRRKTDRRTIMSGGVEFRSQGLALGYMISTKSFDSDLAHHAINLNLKIKM